MTTNILAQIWIMNELAKSKHPMEYMAELITDVLINTDVLPSNNTERVSNFLILYFMDFNKRPPNWHTNNQTFYSFSYILSILKALSKFTI